MTELVPCSGCQRHVRAAESTCPFCGAARAPCAGPCGPALARRRPSRALLLAAGAAAAGVVACTSVQPVYGAPTVPPQDATTAEPDGGAADATTGGDGDR